MTEARIEFAEFEKTTPAARAALTALSKAVDDSGLDKDLTELIKIRASQVNGCAFCVQFHLNMARKFRVPQTKLDLVAVWRDAGVFTGREMAALAWAEALTLVFLTAAVAAINAWNRVAMAFRFSPPVPQEAVTA